jgi:signal peptidase I
MDIVPPRNTSPPAQRPPGPMPQPAPPAAPNPGSYPKDPRFNERGPWRSLLSIVGLLVTAFTIAFLLNTFVIQSYQVDGESMQQTLQNNDRLIVDTSPRTIAKRTGHQYVPKRGEIIIFNEDGLPGFTGPKQLIKRVVGLPGERVVVADGHITIYNSQHPEGFNPDTQGTYHIDATFTGNDVDRTLGQDQLFVCGDNRGNSEDSRIFGPINTNQVVAKLILRILPLNKAKSF